MFINYQLFCGATFADIATLRYDNTIYAHFYLSYHAYLYPFAPQKSMGQLF